MKRILLSEKNKKAPRFLNIEPYLRAQDKPVASLHEAREPRLVPLIVIDYGSVVARLKTIKHAGRAVPVYPGSSFEPANRFTNSGDEPGNGRCCIHPCTADRNFHPRLHK